MQWNIISTGPKNNQDSPKFNNDQRLKSDLSKGIGLALLSKVLGVEEMNTKFSHLLEKIKRSK